MFKQIKSLFSRLPHRQKETDFAAQRLNSLRAEIDEWQKEQDIPDPTVIYLHNCNGRWRLSNQTKGEAWHIGLDRRLDAYKQWCKDFEQLAIQLPETLIRLVEMEKDKILASFDFLPKRERENLLARLKSSHSRKDY